MYIKEGLVSKITINPPTSSVEVLKADGGKFILRNFLATDNVIKKLLASGVDLSINWMQRE